MDTTTSYKVSNSFTNEKDKRKIATVTKRGRPTELGTIWSFTLRPLYLTVN
jgi:hypothetical protein